MKRVKQIVMGLALVLLVTTGCDSMLDVDSDRFITPDENYIDSPNDTIFSIVGIVDKLQKVGVRYVLLGELRGDLLGISQYSGKDVRDIYNFQATADNPFVSPADYYTIINGCNYLINNIDTALVIKAEKRLYKEFAAAKAIRAWTYMQLALNFKTATYYTNPILTIKDAQQTYPEYTLDQLAPLLIADLEPYKNVEKPGISFSGFVNNDNISFFPIKFILGDLYLWTGQYEKAATEYHDLMFDKSITTNYYQSTWDVTNGVFVSRSLLWNACFNYSSYEQMTVLTGSTVNTTGSVLDSLVGQYPQIVPSEISLNNWAAQKYYHTATVVNDEDGDLRGKSGSYYAKGNYYITSSNSSSDYTTAQYTENTIRKYYSMSTTSSFAVSVYRKALLYLRYAEAVNRLGKPNLAFAVLKNGLKKTTFDNSTLIPVSERGGETLPAYMNFNDNRFDKNIGIHERGCGNVNLATDYKIPSLGSKEDSIVYVEDKIVEELALETAFEGNRFQDLMRIALRRNQPSYLADKVGARSVDLINPSNWYLPVK